jgi:hypothetical protein
MEKKHNPKPEYDRLSESVQVLLKKNEFKNFDRIRRESPFPSNSSYVRAMILERLKKSQQQELL